MTRAPSLSDWAVAARLAEGPAHGFALARAFAKEAPLGQVWTVQRQQVYRALEHLEGRGWASREREEPGRGPSRTVWALTPGGRDAVEAWRLAPVGRLRDVRHALLLKLVFLDRAGVDRAPLVRAQRREAEAMVVACDARGVGVEGAMGWVVRWRLESARALLALLEGA